MLDNVLESKVRNKILIFMILFNNNVIYLEKILLYLNISEVYLKDLVNELNLSLHGKATIEFQKDKHIKIMLNENVCYLEILHIIYQESFILKYFDFIINNHENQPFSIFIKQNYHSVANAYRIKNKAEKFLNQIGLATTKNQLTGPEYRIRFLSLSFIHNMAFDIKQFRMKIFKSRMNSFYLQTMQLDQNY